jgi:hypothetical protein
MRVLERVNRLVVVADDADACLFREVGYGRLLGLVEILVLILNPKPLPMSRKTKTKATARPRSCGDPDG